MFRFAQHDSSGVSAPHSQRFHSSFTGSDTDRLFHLGHKDFAVADFSGLGLFQNRLDSALRAIVGDHDLKSAGNSASPMRLGEEMIAKSVCRHAVKANDPLRYPEVEKLIRDLLDCDLPYCCPHGRPTMIQISLAELEKKFGRKV